MQAIGELKENKIIVTKPKEIPRLTKSSKTGIATKAQ